MRTTEAELKAFLKEQKPNDAVPLGAWFDTTTQVSIVRELLRCRKTLRIARRFLKHHGREIRVSFPAYLREEMKPKRRGKRTVTPLLPIFDREGP